MKFEIKQTNKSAKNLHESFGIDYERFLELGRLTSEQIDLKSDKAEILEKLVNNIEYNSFSEFAFTIFHASFVVANMVRDKELKSMLEIAHQSGHDHEKAQQKTQDLPKPSIIN